MGAGAGRSYGREPVCADARVDCELVAATHPSSNSRASLVARNHPLASRVKAAMSRCSLGDFRMTRFNLTDRHRGVVPPPCRHRRSRGTAQLLLLPRRAGSIAVFRSTEKTAKEEIHLPQVGALRAPGGSLCGGQFQGLRLALGDDFASSSRFVQSEQDPQTENRASAPFAEIHPVLLGGEAGPWQMMHGLTGLWRVVAACGSFREQ